MRSESSAGESPRISAPLFVAIFPLLLKSPFNSQIALLPLQVNMVTFLLGHLSDLKVYSLVKRRKRPYMKAFIDRSETRDYHCRCPELWFNDDLVLFFLPRFSLLFKNFTRCWCLYAPQVDCSSAHFAPGQIVPHRSGGIGHT